jgi:poly(3-hydroxybutyrate) depolymerase
MRRRAFTYAGVTWRVFCIIWNEQAIPVPESRKQTGRGMRRYWKGILVLLLLATTSACIFTRGKPERSAMVPEIKDLPNKDVYTIDPSDPMNCFMDGLYSSDIEMEDGTTRQVLHYYPAGLGYRMPVVFIIPPDGADAATFLAESGWITMADEKDFMAVGLVSGAGGWMQDELGYSGKVYDFVQSREFYTNDDSAYYLVGYGAGADVALAEAMMHGDLYAGVAGLGAECDLADTIALAESTESGEAGRMQSTVPVPVWIGAAEENASLDAVVDYWKKANDCGDLPLSGGFADEIYAPVPYLQTSRDITDNNLSKVVVSLGKRDYVDGDFTAHLWDEFLSRARRQDSYQIAALRYFASPEELGMDHLSAMVDGMMREWYVYVPSAVKDGSADSAPVVLSFHGNAGWGYEFTSRSGWYQLAEDRNFILVTASGSRNPEGFVAVASWRDGDQNYVAHVLDDTLDRYPVADPTRVYLTGQSAGSLFSLQLAYFYPDRIAAVASTSLLWYPGARGPAGMAGPASINMNVVAPVFASVGDYDRYLGQGDARAANLDGYFAAWTERNGAEYSGYDNLLSYKSGWFENLIATNANGVPLVRFQLVREKTHAVIPDEQEVLFDFMSRYTRGADGALHYLGEAVR